jgi:Fur family peroxide stress response transcriptional regulator
MERKLTNTASLLRSHGLRPSKARVLILALLNQRREHLTTQGIHRLLENGGHQLGAATVYQNLNRLAQKGLLKRFIGPDGLARFEANLSPHHHLLCVECGRIVDAGVSETSLRHLNPVDLLTGKPATGWEFSGAQVELKGICPSCRRGKKR